MDHPETASREAVVAGDASGPSVEDDRDLQQNGGQANGESLSPDGVAGGTATTDNTDPLDATTETDDVPAEYPTYHVLPP